MNAKLSDNRRRKHAAEILEQVTKQSSAQDNEQTDTSSASMSDESSSKTISALTEQYNVIREDLMKLREDLGKGYDLAKNWAEENISMRNIFKARTLLRTK